ncbi:hypothetical protein CTEN210_01089 [Chaetoceros tenuissimus]|uniref:Uncharacterized protein n=1 Tax=Chaetoceros tenuissimus TaxID=426638 RepID=A0AAD3GZC2_9STRA|nr:hypothetical protein CTEN210_01089 [Chaetoceros tenuissimus]
MEMKEGNGTDRKKERELETTDHGTDARFLNDVAINDGPGGACDVCGGNYECNSNFGAKSFNDPLGVPVGEMKVEVFGASCSSGPIEVSVNNNVLGEVASLSNSCICGDCYSSSSCLSVDPGLYNAGQQNTIELRKTVDGVDCVDRVELELLPATVSFTQSLKIGSTMTFNFAGVPATNSDVTIDFTFTGNLGGSLPINIKSVALYSLNACSVTSSRLGRVGSGKFPGICSDSNNCFCRTDTTTVTLDKDAFNDLIGTNGEVEFQMIPTIDVTYFARRCSSNVGTISFTVKPTCQAVGQNCAPSSSPTSSIKPSPTPTKAPTSTPSSTPTAIPSSSPSSLPSDIPSDVPSDQPSLLFSSMPSDIPSDVPSDQPFSLPSSMPSDIPSDVPSDQPSLLPSSMPSNIPSDIPSDQPSLLPSSMPSNIPSDIPSDQPSLLPSSIPSWIPSSEPSWVDDEQCKKKDPENDYCAMIDGRCKVDCQDDEDFFCMPGLCSYDRNWDKPTKSPKMRQLKEEEVDIVDIEITADGSVERNLKATKAPSEKGTKETEALSEKEAKTTNAPKSSCACRVPRKRGCKK